MLIIPNTEGMSPFEILYEIPDFRHTPATEAEDTLAEYMRKTLMLKTKCYHHIREIMFQIPRAT